MSSRRPVRQILVAVLLGVLVGGGLMAVTPAGAEVSQAAATSWKKIWKKELKPLAAKSFYTKSKASSTFATKAESTAGDAAAQAAANAAANAATDAKLGGYYKKAESDARYAGAGSGYTKSESDAKYLPAPTTYRGALLAHGYAPAAGNYAPTQIGFPVMLKTAPVVHVVEPGAAVPAGCTGTAAAPGAAPGNLCIFIAGDENVSTYYTCKAAGTSCTSGANGVTDPWGLTMYVSAAAAGRVQAYGSWALSSGGTTGVSTTFAGPGTLVTPEKGSPAAIR